MKKSPGVLTPPDRPYFEKGLGPQTKQITRWRNDGRALAYPMNNPGPVNVHFGDGAKPGSGNHAR